MNSYLMLMLQGSRFQPISFQKGAVKNRSFFLHFLGAITDGSWRLTQEWRSKMTLTFSQTSEDETPVGFFTRASCSNIIIEVVRTHEPDEKTFERLYELSRTNALVVFYIIGEGSRGGKLNNFRRKGAELTLRVSHYFIAGQPYLNGVAVKTLGEDETLAHWHEYLTNSYLKKAKESAS